ncbi:MAG: queuosine precursor transporter [candidate division WOR-3 bacterium]|nr:queuosine precursor transporter [candidate division WOR-3 bacterium]MCX7757970.1 queuosine precursor transporter [candidate division WOR-3 bacterium]MDW7987224.1 queuosine precursor transporter [candidate division WOR-3 bacterium]
MSVVFIWLLTLIIASVSIPYYIRQYKKSDLAIGIYVIYLALSQIIASKIANFNLIIFQFTAPAAVLIFPFTFQITDIVNEAFGRHEVHRMIAIAFITQVLMTLFLYLGTALPRAPFWQSEKAWHEIINLVPRITLASWIAFLVSENLDAILYAQIRNLTKGRYLWIRNIFSDIPSLAVDSIIFVSIAFYGIMPIWSLIFGQIVLKWLIGILDTPFMYLSRMVLYYKTVPASGLNFIDK